MPPPAIADTRRNLPNRATLTGTREARPAVPLVPAKAGTQPLALVSRFRGNERSLVRRVSPKLKHLQSLRSSGYVSGEAHGVDRRQRVRHAGPAVALVLAHPQAARGRAEGEPFAGFIERERVAIDDIVGVLLRQALGQDIEGLAAVARARHD